MNMKQEKVSIGGGSEQYRCTANTSGDLTLRMKGIDDELELIEIELKRVFYLPHFNKKIISVPRLTEDGYEFRFKNQFCHINLPSGGAMKISAANDKMHYLHILKTTQSRNLCC